MNDVNMTELERQLRRELEARAQSGDDAAALRERVRDVLSDAPRGSDADVLTTSHLDDPALPPSRPARGRMLVAAAIVAVVATAVVAVVLDRREQGSVVLDAPPSTLPPASTVPAPPSTEAVDEESGATTVPAAGDPAGRSDPVTLPFFLGNQGRSWVDGALVPWGDGFLVVRVERHDQPLPDAIPDDVADLVPARARTMLSASRTVEEFGERLWNLDAGRDEVGRILGEHPEAVALLLSEPRPEPTVEFWSTTTGESWELIDVVLPDGVPAPGQVASVDGKLTLAGWTRSPADPDQIDVVVASTTDLADWTVTTMPYGPMPDPTGFELMFFPTLAVTADGWALAPSFVVHDSLGIGEPQWSDAWQALGAIEPVVWTALWDEAPASSARDYRPFAAGDGFVWHSWEDERWYSSSPGAVTFLPIADAPETGWPEVSVATETGAIVITSSALPRYWYDALNFDGGTWERIDGPPDLSIGRLAPNLAYSGMSSSQSALTMAYDDRSRRIATVFVLDADGNWLGEDADIQLGDWAAAARNGDTVLLVTRDRAQTFTFG
jgi:hypothetical protein